MKTIGKLRSWIILLAFFVLEAWSRSTPLHLEQDSDQLGIWLVAVFCISQTTCWKTGPLGKQYATLCCWKFSCHHWLAKFSPYSTHSLHTESLPSRDVLFGYVFTFSEKPVRLWNVFRSFPLRFNISAPDWLPLISIYMSMHYYYFALVSLLKLVSCQVVWTDFVTKM